MEKCYLNKKQSYKFHVIRQILYVWKMFNKCKQSHPLPIPVMIRNILSTQRHIYPTHFQTNAFPLEIKLVPISDHCQLSMALLECHINGHIIDIFFLRLLFPTCKVFFFFWDFSKLCFSGVGFVLLLVVFYWISMPYSVSTNSLLFNLFLDTCIKMLWVFLHSLLGWLYFHFKFRIISDRLNSSWFSLEEGWESHVLINQL